MLRIKPKLIATLILGPWASGPLLAIEIPESFHAARPMAMGGAFTAVANDENAVWTNPAGISRIRKHRSRSLIHKIKFPNAIAGVNATGSTFYSLLSGTDEAELASAISDNASTLSEKPFWAMAAAFPMVMFDFGRQLAGVIGGYSHSTMKVTVDSEDPQLANAEIVSDVGGVLSFAATNWTNRFNVGVQVRSIGRYAFEDTIETTALANTGEFQQTLQDNANRSVGLAVDAGFLFTLADFWFPTIGIAILNAPTGCKTDYLNPFSGTRQTVCGTVFQGSFANPHAVSTVDPTDIRVGFSITPRFGRKVALRLAVDMHQIPYASGDLNYGLSDVPLLKRAHIGAELITGNPLLPSPFSLAVGLSQGYYTMGASVRLAFLSIDVTTFGRDISTRDTPEEDRRTMAGFSFDF